MRFVLMLCLLVPSIAAAQVTQMSGSRSTMSSSGASTVGATPAPKKKAKKKSTPAPTSDRGTVTLEPDPNGTVNLVPAQPKPQRPDQGTVNLAPDPNGVATLKPQEPVGTLLPFEDEKKKPVGTLLPFTPERDKAGSKKVSSRNEQTLRDALESDHAESEAQSAKAEKALLAINDALDRRDYDRVAKLLAIAIDDQRKRSAQLKRRKDEIARLLATSK